MKGERDECVLTFTLQNWDLGNGFDMKVVVGAGYAVVVLSIGAALGLALYTPAK